MAPQATAIMLLISPMIRYMRYLRYHGLAAPCTQQNELNGACVCVQVRQLRDKLESFKQTLEERRSDINSYKASGCRPIAAVKRSHRHQRV